jgi:putative transposase
VTDKLRSYIKPIQDLTPDADHRAHKGLNNRTENSTVRQGSERRSRGGSSRLVKRNASCQPTIR